MCQILCFLFYSSEMYLIKSKISKTKTITSLDVEFNRIHTSKINYQDANETTVTELFP